MAVSGRGGGVDTRSRNEIVGEIIENLLFEEESDLPPGYKTTPM